MATNLDLFIQAVKEKKQVICSYQNRYRELCVHVVGWKDGREQALAFQFAGESSKGLPPGGEWRCLSLADVKDATLRSGDWHTRDDHSRPQTCVDTIAAEVAF